MNRATKKRYIHRFSGFKGVDYAHVPAGVSEHRRTDGLNMVRSEVGRVQKRTGYEIDEKQWDGRINGVHIMEKNGEKLCIVHSGNRLYTGDVCIYEDANDDFSQSVQMGNMLYIVDGKKFLVYDGESVSQVKDSAYIPTVYIHRNPMGEGQVYQQANILTAKRKEGFIADGESKEYVLSAPYIAEAAVTAQILNDDGSITEYTEGSGLTVNRTKGTVTFSKAPAVSAVSGKDNVYITYEKGNATGDILDKCTVMTAFGPGGKPDTLFLSGNPDYPGREWFSQPGNPMFFGENNTDLALDNSSEVVGYSTRGDRLFVHRRSGSRNLNILVRKCNGSDENFYTYPVINALAGPSAVSRNSFVNMENDGMFLTENGIYAVCESEADERHFTQMRSFYINPLLLKNESMENAYGVSFEEFYVLGVGNEIYLLDTLQKSYEVDKEYSGYQYEAYHWRIDENIRIMFVWDGRLCFGTDDGRTGRFYSDYSLPQSYNDNGKPISAVWQTGEFDGGSTGRRKSIHRLWAVCAPANYTGITASARIKGIWQKLFSDNVTAGYFSWSKLNWARFTWSCDATPKIILKDVRIKNVDKTAIRLENSRINEPMGIYEIGVEYTAGGYYR